MRLFIYDGILVSMLVKEAAGEGTAKPISSDPLLYQFCFFQNTVYPMNVMFIFNRFYHSLAMVDITNMNVILKI